MLDTWFSSGLWPFSTMGWPEDSAALKKFYPTSCLITGFDILFFWVARMMMMGIKFMGEVPFKDVYIHALVRDAQGQKMSKSKGNVIDPLTVIDEYGTDAFRFTLTAFAAQGRDVKLSTDRIGGYRNFCNKLWNASRFAMMNLADFTPVNNPDWDALNLSMADRWILTRLRSVEIEVNQALTEYRYNEVANTLYAFTWHEFCDWYIELIKGALYGDDAAAKLSAQTVVYTVLERLLRLMHPVTPFITEEIWQKLPGKRPVASIMLSSYPQGAGLLQDDTASAQMEQVMEIIRSIRNIRGEMDVSPAKKITALIDCKNDAICSVMLDGENYIKSLAKIEALTCAVAIEQPEQVAKQVVGDVEILLPLAGLINVEEEEKRLAKEIAKVQKDVDMFSRKLANEKFVANAPAAVLEKDRGKLTAAQEKFIVLQASLEKIIALK